MESLTVRNIDESIKASLRMSAAEHGRSMEEEARQILKQFLLRKKSSAGIGSRISRRFAVMGGGGFIIGYRIVTVDSINPSTPRVYAIYH